MSTLDEYNVLGTGRKTMDINMMAREFSVMERNAADHQDAIYIPIPEKLNLSIREAAAYSGIGINKIDTMLRQPNCPFVLFVGSKKLVKRKLFEEYLEHQLVI